MVNSESVISFLASKAMMVSVSCMTVMSDASTTEARTEKLRCMCQRVNIKKRVHFTEGTKPDG